MTDLLDNPLWQADDLGKPMPDSVHAVSVCLPTWQDVAGYEERDPRVMKRLKCGYPRFVIHPLTEQLFGLCTERFARPEELTLAFPSRAVAERCVAFLHDRVGCEAHVDDFGSHGIVAVSFPEAVYDTARHFWMHFGEIVSSRRAEAALSGTPPTPAGNVSSFAVRERLAHASGAAVDDVFLYPSGMAALSAAMRVVRGARLGAKSAQLGFPYVDVLKVQRVTGPGVRFLHDPADLDALEAILRRERLSAVICEFPGNPLLQAPELRRLSYLLHHHGLPLVVDDTTSTCVNTNLWPHADMVMTSLTKHFSGKGDVMAGALTLNDQSPFYQGFASQLRHEYEDLLYADDAVVLERNSRDFAARVRQANATAEQLCEYLKDHPAVARIYSPRYETPVNYVHAMRLGGGYGSLFSMVLRDAPKAVAFYDRLRVCKGPSLGNNFTLACPYTLLAHYDELDWVESLGVSRWLVRVSVGLEAFGDLRDRFNEALTGL